MLRAAPAPASARTTGGAPVLFLFLALLVCGPPPPAAAQEWNRHVIDAEAGENIGEHCSLAIEGSRIAVSYYFDEAGVQGYLKCALYDGSTWDLTVVDDEDLSNGDYGSIAFDPSDGNAAIVYRSYAGENYFLKYAKHDGRGWTTEAISLPDGVTNATAGRGRTLSFTPDGTPHVAWFSSGSSDLYLSSRVGGVWTHDLIEDAGYLGPAVSLLHDNDALPWLAIFHNNGSADVLEYAHYGGAWEYGDIYGPTNNAGEYNALALYRPTGQLIASFREGVYIKTYEWDPGVGEWTRFGSATAPGNQGDNTYNSCAFDGAGTYAITYFNDHDNSLRYVYWNGSSWRRSIVDDTRHIGEYCSLGFYQDSTAVVACYDVDEEAAVIYVDGELGGSGTVAPAATGAIRSLAIHPNPIVGAARVAMASVRFSLSEAAVPRLELLDARGALIRELDPAGAATPGQHLIVWDGRDRSGRTLPSGTYFLRLTAGRSVRTRSVRLIR